MSTTFAGPNWKVVWAPEGVDRAIDGAWPVAVKQVLNRTRDIAPKGKTKNLSRNLKAQVQRRSATIISPALYSKFVIEGTPPHVIRPKPATQERPRPALRFEVQGGVVFAKSVQHPGTKPNNFLAEGASILPLAFSVALKARL